MRLTLPTATVLCALDRGLAYGFEILDATGLRAGTVYPVLRRLEDNRLVRSSWEDAAEARAEGRPPRRNYRLTREGEAMAAEAAERYPGAAHLLDVVPGGGHASA